jgi:hypothetical protein
MSEVHYVSTHSDYDGCTREDPACYIHWYVKGTKKVKEVTCKKCLRRLDNIKWKIVDDTLIDGEQVVLYNSGVEIGVIDIPIKDIIESKGYKDGRT